MPVVIVAAARGADRSCATATLMYASLAPPMVVVALHPGGRTTALVEATGELSVSLLGEGQMEVAVKAGHGARTSDKLAELELPAEPSTRGFLVPGIAGSLAILWGRVDRLVPVGDHVLVVATIEEHADHGSEAAPLLRYRRRYAAIGAALGDAGTDRYPI